MSQKFKFDELTLQNLINVWVETGQRSQIAMLYRQRCPYAGGIQEER